MVPRSLPRLRIAIACNVDWNAMVGNDRARVCGQCCQTVYNVEKLRPREVADLLERHGDRMPCLRLLHRPDGTVVTRSCMTWALAGLRAVRISVWSIAALAVGFWSQVFLWRGLLHREPLPPAPMSTAATPPPPASPALNSVTERLERERRRLIERIERERNHRRHTVGGMSSTYRVSPPHAPDRLAVTTDMVKEALRPAIAELESRGGEVPNAGRVEIVLDVKASGRVSRVRIEAAADRMTPAGRKLIHAVVRKLRLPRNSEPYQTSFTVLFQGRS